MDMSLQQQLDVDIILVGSEGIHGHSAKIQPDEKNEKLVGKTEKQLDFHVGKPMYGILGKQNSNLHAGNHGEKINNPFHELTAGRLFKITGH